MLRSTEWQGCFWCNESINSLEKYSFCSKQCMEEWGEEYMKNNWREYAKMMGARIVE